MRGPPNVPSRPIRADMEAENSRGDLFGKRSDENNEEGQTGSVSGNGTVEKLSDEQLERLAVQLSNGKSPTNILTSTLDPSSLTTPRAPPTPIPPLQQPTGSTSQPFQNQTLATSSRQSDELSFNPFPSLPRSSLHINKLPALLASYEGEREDEEMRERRRGERRWMMERAARGEEYEESDDEDGDGEKDEQAARFGGGRVGNGDGINERTEQSHLGEPDSLAVPLPPDQQPSLIPIFERRLLELFLDGLDPELPYDKIDFGLCTEQDEGWDGRSMSGGERLMERDREERYFDEEEEVEGEATVRESGLAEGEYDY